MVEDAESELAVEETAARLLRDTGLAGRPSEAIAEAVGHPVVREYIGPEIRGESRRGEAEITIAPDLAVREQLAIGHELMELHLPLGLLGDWERLCQRGAAALLVPAQKFLSAMLTAEANLMRLAKCFPHASIEVVGNRFVDLHPRAAFMVHEPSGYRYARAATVAPSAAELDVLRHLASGAMYAVASRGRWVAQAWRSRRRPERAVVLAIER